MAISVREALDSTWRRAEASGVAGLVQRLEPLLQVLEGIGVEDDPIHRPYASPPSLNVEERWREPGLAGRSRS